MTADLKDCLLNALKKTKRAEIDIANFDGSVQTFFKFNPFAMVPEEKLHPLHQQVNIFVRQNPVRTGEDGVAETVTLEALSSTAKSIAIALWRILDDVVQCIAIPGEGRAEFPASFGKGPKEPASFQREIARFPENIRELIRTLEPHGGRNGEPLWILKSVARGHMEQILEVAPVPSKHFVARLKAIPGVKIDRSHWHPTNHCLVLLTAPRKVELNEDFKSIPLNVVFRGIKIRAGQTATQTLTDARELVCGFIGGVLEMLEREII